MRYVALTGIALIALSSWAGAQETSFMLSAGYSNVQISHNAGPFYSRDGGYVDGEFLWRVPNGARFPFLLGAALGLRVPRLDARCHLRSATGARAGRGSTRT